jgi:hypothetical protein
MSDKLTQQAIFQCLTCDLCNNFEFFVLNKGRFYKKHYKLLMALGEIK